MSDGLVQILVRHRRLLLMGPPPLPATSNPTSPTVQASRRVQGYSHFRDTFRSARCAAVARLQAACSGPVYVVRTRSECPKSQGSPRLIRCPQRAQRTQPDARSGSSNLRRRRCA